MIEFTFPGDVPSKKNQKMVFKTKSGRPYVTTSLRYKHWKKDITLIVPKSRSKPRKRVEAVILRFWSKTARKSDLTNKAESVMDMLVDLGYLEDDNWNVVSQVELIYEGKDADNPRCEVSIIC